MISSIIPTQVVMAVACLYSGRIWLMLQWIAAPIIIWPSPFLSFLTQSLALYRPPTSSCQILSAAETYPIHTCRTVGMSGSLVPAWVPGPCASHNTEPHSNARANPSVNNTGITELLSSHTSHTWLQLTYCYITYTMHTKHTCATVHCKLQAAPNSMHLVLEKHEFHMHTFIQDLPKTHASVQGKKCVLGRVLFSVNSYNSSSQTWVLRTAATIPWWQILWKDLRKSTFYNL